MYDLDFYGECALKIWENHPDVAKDRVRWHSSDYHIQEKSLTVDDAVEDALEALDIDPTECQIEMPIWDWQENYLLDPKMVSAMAETIYANLAHHNRYSFDEEPNWDDEAEEYICSFF